MTGISSMAQQTNTGGSGSFYTPAGSPQARTGAEQLQMKNVERNSKLISGSMGTLSALGGIASGFAERASLKTDAYNYDYQAKAAQLEGQRQALLEMDSFAQAQARSIAAIGASGIGFEGSPVTGLRGAEDKHKSELGLIKAGADVNVAGYKGMAKQARRSAKYAPWLGALSGAQQAASMFIGGGGR